MADLTVPLRREPHLDSVQTMSMHTPAAIGATLQPPETTLGTRAAPQSTTTAGLAGNALRGKLGAAGSGAESADVSVKVGQVVYEAGTINPNFWVVERGAVRLDFVEGCQDRLVQVVFPGYHLGVESLFDSATLHRATAITQSTLRRLIVKSEATRVAMLTATQTEAWQLSADMLAMRTGPVANRVRRMLLSLSAGERPVRNGLVAIAQPRLRCIGEITDSSPETVSRILSVWRDQGLLCSIAPTLMRINREGLAKIEISHGITGSSRAKS